MDKYIKLNGFTGKHTRSVELGAAGNSCRQRPVGLSHTNQKEEESRVRGHQCVQRQFREFTATQKKARGFKMHTHGV